MSTRQIEWTEIVRLADGEHQPGDRTTYSADVATKYIALGWAMDPATEETGERRPGANGPLNIDTVTQKASAT